MSLSMHTLGPFSCPCNASQSFGILYPACTILQLALVGICLGIGFSLFEVAACLIICFMGLLFSSAYFCQGFTFPVRAYFLEDVLEMTGYKLTSYNQIDDYGQEKMWKTQKQLVPRKRKNQITSLVEVYVHMYITFNTFDGVLQFL